MLALGTQAPDFALPDVVTGKTVALKDFAQARALLVMFICRHCPYVVHVCDELARIGRDYADKGAGIVAISSNDATSYPDDAPKKLKEMAIETGFTFPLCHDESQAVAKAYAAACTRPGGRAANGHDLRAALDAVLAGRPVNPDQKPSVGCNIKWKPAK